MIYQMGGIRGFWKGLSPALLEMVSGTAVYFQILQKLNSSFKDMGVSSKKTDFMSSGIARVASTYICVPLAVIRTRVQMPGFTDYTNVFDGFRKIYAQEGVRGFFRGPVPSMVKDGLFMGFYYALMNEAKVHLKPLKLEPTANTMVAGMTAGVIATIVTHPFEIIRTMAQADSSVKVKKDGVMRRLNKIWKREGISGLSKGLGPALVKKPLANAMTFTLFEFFKSKSE
jgi:solute carrier family 25 protein 38